jgi:hypothetical protein
MRKPSLTGCALTRIAVWSSLPGCAARTPGIPDPMRYAPRQVADAWLTVSTWR